jgi:hypothetical protein
MGFRDFHFVAAAPTAGTQMGMPIADYNAGGSISDIICMSKYKTAYFMLLLGARTGSTAAPVLTVVPCTDAAGGTTTTAIPFHYKRVSSGETNTAWTSSSSLTVTTGNNQAYIIAVKAEDLPQVSGVTYEYCYVNSTEPANDPQVGAMLIVMDDARYAEDTPDAVTA